MSEAPLLDLIAKFDIAASYQVNHEKM